MKYFITALIALYLFGLGIASRSQNVGINDDASTPNSSAMLDVQSTTKGMLIPRVVLTSATDASTIASPATSLLVYNTATAGTYPDNVVPGFYYWDGTKWNSIIRQTGVLAFADFYAIMPSDNTTSVAPGAAVAFPNTGPTSGGSDITNTSSTTFQLSAIGTYMVSWQVSVTEPGQLALKLNDTENLTTVVGRATGTSQIAGNRLITTVAPNSILRVVNPTGNSTALTITPLAGGTSPVSASLVITRIQ